MNPVSQMEAAIVARIQQAPEVAGTPTIEVINVSKTDVNQRLEQVLKSKIGNDSAAGIAVVVAVPRFEAGDGERVCPIRADVTVQVWEQILINQGATGSQKPALEIVFAILRHLTVDDHGRRFSPTDLWTPTDLVDCQLAELGHRIAYDMTFRTSTEFTPSVTAVENQGI